MSESSIEQPSSENPQLGEWGKVAIVAGILIVLMALLIWSLNRNANERYRQFFGRAVDGLAAAMQQNVIERNSSRTSSTLQRVVEAAGLESAAITDPTGTVIAASEPGLVGTRIAELSKPPTKAVVKEGDDGAFKGFRAIVLGTNNVIGGLMVVSK